MCEVKLYLVEKSTLTYEYLISLVDLSDQERELIDNTILSEKKIERLISIYLKKKFVGEYFYNEYKKPISNEVFFNISHSSKYVILGLSDTEIGVDIEDVKLVPEQLKKHISSNEELGYIKDNRSFFEIWTNKESLVKCIGTGLVKKVNTIPGLPVNGARVVDGETYFSKTISYENSVISLTLKTNNNFEIKFTKLEL